MTDEDTPMLTSQCPISGIGRTRATLTLDDDNAAKLRKVSLWAGDGPTLKASVAAPPGCPCCRRCGRVARAWPASRRGSDDHGIGLRLWQNDDLAPRPDDVFQERLYCVRWRLPSLDALLWAERRAAHGDGATTQPRTHQDRNDAFPEARPDLGARASSRRRAEGSGPFVRAGWKPALPGKAPAPDWVDLERAIGALAEWLGADKRRELGELRKRDWLAEDHALEAAQREFDSMKEAGRPKGAAEAAARRLRQLKEAVRTVDEKADIWLTDPPYADAVNYHELSEFFLAWYERRIIELFPTWYADSKRALAVQGTESDFRQSMVDCYRNLTAHMPDNGLQVVMFTHQDASVWADLTLILWAAGLPVTAAWTIATATESALKEGNYVQGTVLMVLRKQTSEDTVFLDELGPEVETEVERQLDDRDDRNFSDADYQLAAYAAALRVLTKYGSIQDIDIAYELSREQRDGDANPIEILSPFGRSLVRHALYAVWRASESGEVAGCLTWLRTELADYWPRREALTSVLRYLAGIEIDHWYGDAAAARVVAGAVDNDHI